MHEIHFFLLLICLMPIYFLGQPRNLEGKEAKALLPSSREEGHLQGVAGRRWSWFLSRNKILRFWLHLYTFLGGDWEEHPWPRDTQGIAKLNKKKVKQKPKLKEQYQYLITADEGLLKQWVLSVIETKYADSQCGGKTKAGSVLWLSLSHSLPEYSLSEFCCWTTLNQYPRKGPWMQGRRIPWVMSPHVTNGSLKPYNAEAFSFYKMGRTKE